MYDDRYKLDIVVLACEVEFGNKIDLTFLEIEYDLHRVTFHSYLNR